MSATLVHVDVVEKGRALITGPTFSGYVARRDNGQLYVEDTDTEEFVGWARTYRQAGSLLAAHHHLTNPQLEVHYER